MSLNHKFPNLDSETIELLSDMTGGDPFDITAIPINEARDIATEYLTMVGSTWTPPSCVRTPIKLEHGSGSFLIEPESTLEKDSPLVIWFHGGGWVFGSAALHAPYAQELSHRSSSTFAEVEYPLAPETSGAKIIQECVAATREIISKYHRNAGGFLGLGKTKRPVIVGGESAGATLALFVAKEMGKELIDKVVVANPLVDFRTKFDYPSRHRCSDDGIMQAWPEFDWFISQFAGEKERDRLSFLSYAPDHYPETTVLLGEYDVLLDEGLSLAESLQMQGANARAQVVPGAIHNSIEFGPVTPTGRAFLDLIAHEIKTVGQDPGSDQRE